MLNDIVSTTRPGYAFENSYLLCMKSQEDRYCSSTTYAIIS
jgi:hypothetical protein